MFILVYLVCYVLFADAAPSISTEHFTMGEYFARALPWSLLLSGQIGSRPTIPRRIHSFSCQNKLFVTWTAHAGMTPNLQYPEENLFDEVSVGHITEFSVSGGVTTLVKDVELDWCNEMGNVDAASDCSVVTVLCRSDREPSQVTGSIDLVEKKRIADGDYPFGWYVLSQDDLTKTGYRIVDHMYLLEYTNGGLADQPNTKVMVGRNIGGWNYGHWEVSLNTAKSKYYVSLKTTIGSGESGWHEGETSFTINRADWTTINVAWACGTGHIQANRITYNKDLDMWARFCWTDYNYEQNAPNAMFYATMPGTGKAAQLRSIQSREGANWNGNGGSMNMVSLGQSGFLGSVLGPGGDGNPITVGVIKVPGGQENFDGYSHKFKWLDLPGTTEDTIVPLDNNNKIGFANLQRIGSNSDNRFLLGWATGVEFGGIPKKYFVAEIDDGGCLIGSATELSGAGWGQDNAWTRIPDSGCIAMPYVWLGATPSGQYASCNDCADKSVFSKRLSITIVCPGTKSSQQSCNFVNFEDPLPSCTDGLQNGDEEGIDCGGTRCPTCPVLNEGGECWNSGCRAGGPCPSKCGSGHCCRTGFDDEGCGNLGCGFHCCTDVSSVVPVVTSSPTSAPTNTPITTSSPTSPPTSLPTPSPTPIPQCPKDGGWVATNPGLTASQSCPIDSSGSHTRRCSGSGNWLSAVNTCVQIPTCFDLLQNGQETGVDCGGSCNACSFCAGVTCTFGTCQEQNRVCLCDSGYTGERCEIKVVSLCEQVQCGTHGSCNEADGLCTCLNGYTGSICDTPPHSCDDAIKNGKETGIDCGGACIPCTTHSWDMGFYSQCSVSCGEGMETRTATCIDPTNKPVEDSQCQNAGIHRPVTTVPCYPGSCPTYTWTVEAWQGCSATCGQGIEIRNVYCLSNGGEVSSKVNSENCNCDVGNSDTSDCVEIPPSSRSCNLMTCTENNWRPDPWQPCSRECGGGIQNRTMTCYSTNGTVISDINCDHLQQPSTLRSCNTGVLDQCQTYSWGFCNYEECTASCGGSVGMLGYQHRDVFCKNVQDNRVDNSLCNPNTKFTTTIDGCGIEKCTSNNWMADGPWTACVDGLQTRTFHCHDAAGLNAADSVCVDVPVPRSEMPCSPNVCSVFITDTDLSSSYRQSPVTLSIAISLCILVLGFFYQN